MDCKEKTIDWLTLLQPIYHLRK
uniref:Uncharacterized protein n=1 Tax=Tetranychus urticae TaxID=32264 RepID=T1L2F8_TETUR